MTDNPLLTDLANLSRKIGAHCKYVQGGGGNTSVKLDGTMMAIKASGQRLSNMSATDGYSLVTYPAIVEYLDTPDDSDNDFYSRIKSFRTTPDKIPSIETGFHAFLGQFVLHTHSVYANILNCCVEGPQIAKELFPDALWIPYETPGRDLTLSMKDMVRQNGKIPSILFLENHGVITTGDNADDVYDLHEDISAKIIKRLNISTEFDVNNCNIENDFMKQNVLFPDQVVFTIAEGDIRNTPSAKETIAAYCYILQEIKNAGLTSHFIPQEKIAILLNMESEKFRQKVALK